MIFEGFIKPVLFNGVSLKWASVALDVTYELPAKSYYTCRYVFAPQEIGLPNKDGINQIICSVYWYFYPDYNGFGANDTILVNAPAFYGGPISVNFPIDSSASVTSLRDSLKAQVVQSDTSLSNISEIWQTSGFIIDSLVYTYSKDSRFNEIRPYRYLWPGSVFITSLEKQADQPAKFELLLNYPNPFNQTTMINYSVGASQYAHHVNLSVYNMMGQKVAALVNENQPGGSSKVPWDASRYASGIYFYRLQAADFSKTRKMILLR